MFSKMTSFLCLCLFAPSVFSAPPPCVRSDMNSDFQDIADNERVLFYKNRSEDGFTAEAYVHGKFVRTYREADHERSFQIQIGIGPSDTVEIQHRGDLPKLKPGDEIWACGHYETRNKDSYWHEASPDGARINETQEDTTAWPGHQDGFLVINGRVYDK